jgi:alpha-N-arabinofuranosidase
VRITFEQFLAASQDLDHRIEVVEGLIKAAQSGQENPRPIYIAYDEWNVWYRARGGNEAVKGLEEIYNYEDALAMGMFFNSFFRHAHIVKMANLAQLVNGIAPIFTNKQGLFLQPIYFPIAEYGKQRGNLALDLLVKSPTYRSGNRPPLGYLDASATYNASTRTVYLNVLNRSEKMDITSRIENVAGNADGSDVQVWELSHDNLKTTHSFGDDRKVHPVTRVIADIISGNAFNYKFPKHSLTIISFRLR